DYDGVGHAELAVFRPSTRQWFIAGQPAISFGGPGDVPVPGDYDGIGRTQVAVYRPSTGDWFVGGHATPVRFGGAHLVPANAPYPSRALTGNRAILSTKGNFAASAVALSTNTTVKAATATSSGQGSTNRGTTSVFSSTTRARPNTALPKQAN